MRPLPWKYVLSKISASAAWVKMVTAICVIMAFLMLLLPLLSAWHLDVTQDRVHSLADGSIKTLADLSESVDVYFYYSKKLDSQIPRLGLYAGQIESLLRQYRDLSGGKIRLYIVDPEPYSDDEDRAVQNGMVAIPLFGGTEQAYFGLYAQSGLGKRAAIPQFDSSRQNLLEYDLTRLFYAMAHPKKPKIGVISGLPMDSDFFSPLATGDGAPAPWIFWLQLSQSYDLEKLPPTISMITDDIDALLIIHPQNLNDAAMYAIDQYMMRRPRAVILLDPHSEATAARQTVNKDAPPASSNLDKLLRPWGAVFDAENVVGDRKSAQRVVLDDGDKSKPTARDYVPWLRLNDDRINRGDPITGNLHRLNMASVGHIIKNPGVDTEFTPLLTSSDDAMLIPAKKIRYMPDPKSLLDEFQPSAQNYILAARLRGVLHSAFGSSPPPVARRLADVKMPDHLPQSADAGNIIVVGDSDFVEDRFWVRVRETVQTGAVQSQSDNADFVMNAIDDVVGSNSFASIRSRQNSDRPLTVMHDIRQAAEKKFRDREKELKQKLDDAQSRLRDLQSESQSSPDKQRAMADTLSQVRDDVIKTRAELRRVQRDLNRDIEGLQNNIRFVLIVLWPLLMVGVVVMGWRVWLCRTRHDSGSPR